MNRYKGIAVRIGGLLEISCQIRANFRIQPTLEIFCVEAVLVKKFFSYGDKTDVDPVFKFRGDPDGLFNGKVAAILG